MNIKNIQNRYLQTQITAILTLFLIFCSNYAKAGELWEDFQDSLIFKPALTFEYQIPEIRTNQNTNFQSLPMENDLKEIENLVFGVNLRLHKYWGINLNWSRFSKESSRVEGYNADLAKKAELNVINYNISSLFYFPIIGDSKLEAFAEIGISDIHNKFQVTIPGSETAVAKDHETALLYGGGLQFAPDNSTISLRTGVQFYDTKSLANSKNAISYRVGIIKYF